MDNNELIDLYKKAIKAEIGAKKSVIWSWLRIRRYPMPYLAVLGRESSNYKHYINLYSI